MGVERKALGTAHLTLPSVPPPLLPTPTMPPASLIHSVSRLSTMWSSAAVKKPLKLLNNTSTFVGKREVLKTAGEASEDFSVAGEHCVRLPTLSKYSRGHVQGTVCHRHALG